MRVIAQVRLGRTLLYALSTFAIAANFVGLYQEAGSLLGLMESRGGIRLALALVLSVVGAAYFALLLINVLVARGAAIRLENGCLKFVQPFSFKVDLRHISSVSVVALPPQLPTMKAISLVLINGDVRLVYPAIMRENPEDTMSAIHEVRADKI